MKKSEKIELRVNVDEKERLTQIAEKRGQTISDVVRDALAGELGTVAPNYPKWPGVLSLCACGISAIALGLGFFGTGIGQSLKSNFDQSDYSLYAKPSFRPVHSTAIIHRDGFSQIYDFQWGGDAYRSTHHVEEIGKNVHRLNISICRVGPASCDEIDNGVMVLNKPAAFVQTMNLNFFENGESLFSAAVKPTRTHGAPAKAPQS